MSGLNKLIFAKPSVYNGTNKYDLVSIGVVTSIDDKNQAGRILVDIKGIDDKTSDDNKSWAFPFLPKHLQVMPKVGESVFVFKLNIEDTQYVDRYWIGPIISQPQKLNNDSHFFSSKAALPSGVVDLEQAPDNIKEAQGVFPNKKYISIQGRNNSDLTFKDNEVLIRAGQHKLNQPLLFNSENVGYIQIKYTTTQQTSSIVNIVGSKINLISHNGSKNFNLTGREQPISDSEMDKILKDAHPIPYGDILLDFIKFAKAYILNHTHPYSGLKPVADKAVADNFINFDLTQINSKNIKID